MNTEKNIIKERMIQYLKSIGSNANQFAEKFIALGLLKDGTKNYLHTKSGIQSDMLIAIAKEYPDLDMNWLLAGKGEKHNEQQPLLNEVNEEENMDDHETVQANMIKNRIKEIINENGYSVSSFAKKIGVHQVTLSQQLAGDRKISLEVVMKIVETFPDISCDWLLMGKTENRSEMQPLSSESRNLEKKNVMDDNTKQILDRMIEVNEKRMQFIEDMLIRMLVAQEKLKEDNKEIKENLIQMKKYV